MNIKLNLTHSGPIFAIIYKPVVQFTWQIGVLVLGILVQKAIFERL